MSAAEAYGIMAALVESAKTLKAAKIAAEIPSHGIASFVTAGNATFTVVSKKTGARFTYRVRASRDAKGSSSAPLFVSVLTGQNNDGDYEFLGTIFRDRGGAFYAHGKKSRIAREAPSAKAFGWFIKRLFVSGKVEEVEVWHAGSCGRCGRTLTVPDSIAMGIGPECASKMEG